MYPHTSQSPSPRGFRRIDATLLHRFPTISQLFLTKNNCTVHDNVSVRQFYIRFIRLTSPRAGDPFGGLYRYYRYSLPQYQQLIMQGTYVDLFAHIIFFMWRDCDRYSTGMWFSPFSIDGYRYGVESFLPQCSQKNQCEKTTSSSLSHITYS